MTWLGDPNTLEPLDSNARRAMSRRRGSGKPQVYFVSCGGEIKVGYSTNLRVRIAEMQTSRARPIIVIGSIPGTRPFERAIHRRLRKFRLRGEGGRVCAEVRATVNGLITNGPASIGLKPIPTVAAPSDFPVVVQSDAEMVFHLGKLLASVSRIELILIAERAGVKPKIALRAAGGVAVSVQNFLRLCAASGLDPITKIVGEPRQAGDLDRALLAIGLRISRKLNRHDNRAAAKAARSSSAAISRVENGHVTSIATVLRVCFYIGTHPFDYCAIENVSRETGHRNTPPHNDQVGP